METGGEGARNFFLAGYFTEPFPCKGMETNIVNHPETEMSETLQNPFPAKGWKRHRCDR